MAARQFDRLTHLHNDQNAARRDYDRALRMVTSRKAGTPAWMAAGERLKEASARLQVIRRRIAEELEAHRQRGLAGSGARGGPPSQPSGPGGKAGPEITPTGKFERALLAEKKDRMERLGNVLLDFIARPSSKGNRDALKLLLKLSRQTLHTAGESYTDPTATGDLSDNRTALTSDARTMLFALSKAIESEEKALRAMAAAPPKHDAPPPVGPGVTFTMEPGLGMPEPPKADDAPEKKLLAKIDAHNALLSAYNEDLAENEKAEFPQRTPPTPRSDKLVQQAINVLRGAEPDASIEANTPQGVLKALNTWVKIEAGDLGIQLEGAREKLGRITPLPPAGGVMATLVSERFRRRPAFGAVLLKDFGPLMRQPPSPGPKPFESPRASLAMKSDAENSLRDAMGAVDGSERAGLPLEGVMAAAADAARSAFSVLVQTGHAKQSDWGRATIQWIMDSLQSAIRLERDQIATKGGGVVSFAGGVSPTGEPAAELGQLEQRARAVRASMASARGAERSALNRELQGITRRMRAIQRYLVSAATRPTGAGRPRIRIPAAAAPVAVPIPVARVHPVII